MKTILVVEDTEAQRNEILESLSRNPDYQVVEAHDGDQGYAMLAKDPKRFDLIFLDYHMPGMNGIDVLRRLEREGKRVACPVVMITTEVESKGSEVKDLNIMAWVVKPFSKHRLEQLVVQIFDFLEKP
ncbi:MAG TPA: response regulator [Oligoflexus sp.]|uniref:response regulator n=1 Tax=Oligoflexus sp. TaxID=1971216 RepID=UPI002D35A6AA|nr:response regulator [Oligoflexus sp.]HYX36254.1 response regulator [Oligoflexus sp.]